MRNLTLSDHAAAQAAAAAARRGEENARRLAAYRGALALRDARIAQRRAELGAALAGRRFLGALSALWRLLAARRVPCPQPPQLMQADADEAAWNAGSEGERRVAACLAERLSDAWVMVGGYRNGKGEIDRVLIGPRGIAAIEVKHLRGAIHCAGGRWWRDRYDRYGNLVAAAEPIADKGGRGPDRQLKEPADALQAHLARNGIDGRVLRLVVFSHEASWIGRLEGLEADAAATLAALDLEPLLARSTLRLDAAGVERAVVALRCDHDYHERRRARGRAACVQ